MGYALLMHSMQDEHHQHMENEERLLNHRLAIVKQLLELFRLERTVYLMITVFCVLVLLICAVMLLVRKEASSAEITGLFGSSGAITYSAGRLLKMWSEAIKVLQPRSKHQNADPN